MAKQVENIEEFIDAKQASKILGMALCTVYVKAASGIIPSWKMEGSVRFLESELVAYRESKRRKSKFEIQNAVDAAIFSHQ